MKKRKKHIASALPRTHKVTILLNDEEYKVMHRYLSKYKITNRSRWMRETVMSSVFRRLSEDYPTLFSEPEMRG
ncbi:MAG: hypothetical protein FWF54_03880 [Candidatus Azobacteroides sp.]|nr:hypothetical protein [Candidatus Azobacteroides sp.]